MTAFDSLMPALTFLAALGCGIMAGLFFVFSNTVMRALGGLPPDKGIAAMQAINTVILNPLFLTLFMGTGLICLGAVVYAILHRGAQGSIFLLAGGLLYLIGVFLVTAAFNVPRNDALAALDPAKTESAGVWREYLSVWTAWNHVRTVTSVAATGSFILAFCQLRKDMG